MAAVLGLLAVAGGAQASQTGHGDRVPPGFVGMMADGPLFNPQVDLGEQFAQMQRSGVETLRVAFPWDQAQPYASWGEVPAAQRPDFTAGPGHVPTNFQTTDEIVRSAARHH